MTIVMPGARASTRQFGVTDPFEASDMWVVWV